MPFSVGNDRWYHFSGSEEYEFQEIQGIHPRCPHCGYDHGHYGPFAISYATRGSNIVCEICGQRFHFTVSVIGRTTPLPREFWKGVGIGVVVLVFGAAMILFFCGVALVLFDIVKHWFGR